MRGSILPGSGWDGHKFRAAIRGGRVTWACGTDQVPGMSGMVGCSTQACHVWSLSSIHEDVRCTWGHRKQHVMQGGTCRENGVLLERL